MAMSANGHGVLWGLRQGIAKTMLGKTYDAAWFARFLKLADEEDWAAGTGLTDSYKQHAWVNIAVTTIARNIARAEFKQYTGEDELQMPNPLVKLFMDVNPYMSKYQLWEATVSWLKITGECMWTFEPGYAGGTGKIPTEIYVNDPRLFRHILDPQGQKIMMWKFEGANPPVPFLPDEVIHFAEWNKWDKFRGKNPLVALGDELEEDYSATQSNKALLANRSTPPGVLTSEKPLTHEQALEIKELWEKQHRGAKNQGKIGVMGYGTKFQQIALSPQDMEYMGMKRWNRSAILARYGVPPACVGVKEESSTLSGKDTEEQMRQFWSFTLVPLCRFLEDKLRTDFYGRFNLKGVEGRFDLSEIGELQENKETAQIRLREDVKAGLRTINEIREEQGFDPVEWGDTWWVPLGLTPADQAMEEPEPVPAVLQPFVGGKPPKKPPAEEEEEAAHSAATLFKAKHRVRYTDTFKTGHWYKIIKRWEPIERAYAKDLKDWMFKQRSRALDIVMNRWKTGEGAAEVLMDDAYWQAESVELKNLSKKVFMAVTAMNGEELAALFADLGIEAAIGFDIFNTRVLDMIAGRVTKVAQVTDTIKDAIRDTVRSGVKEGWTTEEIAEGIRGTYSSLNSRAATIARTEIGGVINDGRIAGYKEIGFEAHSWLTARDERVRELHQIDGEVRSIGEEFSNGLLYPNDPNGEAGNTVNCRCLTLPETQEGLEE